MAHEEQALIHGLPDDIALDCLARVPLQFHSGLRPVCRRWRDLFTTPFFRRYREMIGTTEDLIFMVQALVPVDDANDSGGGDDAEASGQPKEEEEQEQTKSSAPPIYTLSVYNDTLRSWHRVAPAVPMFAQCAAVGGGRLALVGGWDPATLDPVPDVRVIDVAAGAWREAAPMSAARSFFACAAGGGRLYVAGGHDGQKNALRSAEAYDAAADEWAALPAMAEERDECMGVAAAAGGRFWAVSGYGTERQGRFDGSAEWYDPVAGEWCKEEEILLGGGGGGGATSSAAFFSVGERLWCVDCGGERREVREYGGREEGWRAVAPVPEGMKSNPCAAVVGGGGERVVVMGKDGDGSNGAWVLEVGSRKWRRVEVPPGFSGFVYSATALCL